MTRLRKSTKRMLFIGVSLTLLFGCIFIVFHIISTKQVREVYEEEIAVLNGTISTNTKQVYVASKDIKYGEKISIDNVTGTSEIVSLDSSMFFSISDIGAKALIDIPMGTVITSNMFTYEEYDNTLRESEFDVLVLNSNLTNGDYIDVRIRYKNGEDYVVLSKKRVKNLSLRNAVCYLDLVEEEMHLISSSIVDASVYGAVLYTTTYLEPSIQMPSTVTYQPSKDVLKIIYSNPNIISVATANLSVSAREEMQKRLMEYDSSGLSGGNVFNVSDVPNVENGGNMQNGYVEIEE